MSEHRRPDAAAGDTIGKRIARRREAIGMSQSELARRVGQTQPSISDIEAGKRKRPFKLVEIASQLGVTPEWLLHGGPPLETPSETTPEPPADGGQPLPATVTLPHGGHAIVENEIAVPLMDVHDPSLAGARGRLILPVEMLQFTRIRADQSAFVEVIGDAMEPALFERDLVLIDTSWSQPSPPGLFAIWDEAIIVRRLEVVRGRDMPTVRVGCINPDYSSYEAPIEEIQIIGRYVGKFTTR